MFDRLRNLLTRACRPTGTPYRPDSFGLDDQSFFLAVLRAAPVNSTLHLNYCEEEAWAEALRNWSHRKNSDRLEADHYRIDDRFIGVVELLLKEDPASLESVDQVSVRSPEGRWLMASLDNFSIITELDELILEKLPNPL